MNKRTNSERHVIAQHLHNSQRSSILDLHQHQSGRRRIEPSPWWGCRCHVHRGPHVPCSCNLLFQTDNFVSLPQRRLHLLLDTNTRGCVIENLFIDLIHLPLLHLPLLLPAGERPRLLSVPSSVEYHYNSIMFDVICRFIHRRKASVASSVARTIRS